MARCELILLPLLASCGLLNASFEGTSCDDTHPCPDGLACGASPDAGANHTGVCQVGSVDQTFHFNDDFESGRFASTYDQITKTAQDTVEIIPAAAHRGDAGFRSIDDDTSSNSSFEAYITAHYGAWPGDQYFRGWVRIDAAAGQDTEILKSEEPTFNFGQWDVVWIPGGSLRLGAWVSKQEFHSGYTDAGALPIGDWHLLEVVRLGSQTPDASIELFLDTRSVQHIEHFGGGQQSGGLELGAFFQENQPSTMTLDWDDVRLTSAPTPDRLALIANVPPGKDGCSPFEVRMLDVFGNIRPALYSFVLESDAGIYSDAICNQPGATFPAGEGRFTVYTKAGESVDVRYVDYFSSSLSVEGTPCGCSSNGSLAALAALFLLKKRTRRLSAGNRQLSERG